jgi:heptosyltransferase-1
MRLLIVRLSAMGDIVHALPLAQNARLAGVTVGWLVERSYAGLLSPAPTIDRLFLADTRRWRRRPLSALTGARALFRELADFAPDLAIDAQGLWKSALLARRARAPVVGFAAPDRKERASALLCDHPVRPAGGARHVVDRNLALLEASGIPVACRAPDATYLLKGPVPEEARDFVAALPRPFALYHPGARRPEKAWGEENFAALAAKVLSQRDLSPVISWGPGDEARARRLASLLPEATVAPHLDFAGLAHAIASCTLFVAGDTGPLHLADALGARTLALFGPTEPERNGPYRRPESALRYNAKTSVEAVAKRAAELLAEEHPPEAL